jgi:hypothetical protein
MACTISRIEIPDPDPGVKKAPDPGSATLLLSHKNKSIFNLAELITFATFKAGSPFFIVLWKLGCYLPYLTLGIFSARFRHCAGIGALLADAGRLAGALRVGPAANLHCKRNISAVNNPLSFNDDSDPEPGYLLIADLDLLFRSKDAKNSLNQMLVSK